MGRYYYGDIEGKFAFAIQPSTAPEDFLGAEPVRITYSWSGKDEIKQIIDKIKQGMGERFNQIEEFFSKHDWYNDKELAEFMRIPEHEVKDYLLDYYNYKLGEKVYNYMVENNTDCCEIDAEL